MIVSLHGEILINKEKKIAIMQPYFLPYIGYFQLINSVDLFVIADDLNYIKNGYINKNTISIQNSKYQFTLNLKKASQNKLISEIEVGDNRGKLLDTFKRSYKKAPYFKDVYPIIEQILNNEEKNLARFIYYSLIKICEYIGISTKFIYSSEIKKDNTLKFDDKIINICHLINSNHYINPIGGFDLYSKDKFSQSDIKLEFLKMSEIKYPQFTENFLCCLSILDVLMFNSIQELQILMLKCDLI